MTKRRTRKKVCIIIPTYNEKENIAKLLDILLSMFEVILNFKMSVLVVDDTSPDGTGELVKEYARKNKNIHLLEGKKEGLGKAYVRGFLYAIKKIKPDFIFEMDADFQHNPHDIPRFLIAAKNGADFIIGSRYVKGGSIPSNWTLFRKLNSSFGNILLDLLRECMRYAIAPAAIAAFPLKLSKK